MRTRSSRSRPRDEALFSSERKWSGLSVRRGRTSRHVHPRRPRGAGAGAGRRKCSRRRGGPGRAAGSRRAGRRAGASRVKATARTGGRRPRSGPTRACACCCSRGGRRRSPSASRPGRSSPPRSYRSASSSLSDELRAHVRETLVEFTAAGIDLKIVSGDNPHTVASLARQAGLRRPAGRGAGSGGDEDLAAISGADLEAMDAGRLRRRRRAGHGVRPRDARSRSRSSSTPCAAAATTWP